MSDVALLVVGLIVLIVGGELFVRGAATTAARFGVPPLLIGLTLVGFGTSLPELVTSIEASMIGSPGIAIGNIVGSNIANVLLILGLAAAISPIAVGPNALRRDATLALLAAFAFTAVGFLLPFDRLVGLLFLASLAAYIYYAYRQETGGAPAGHTAAFEKGEAREELRRRDGATAPGRPVSVRRRLVKLAARLLPLILAVGGLAAIILGARLLVGGAVGIASAAGVSQAVIGLTVVAIGTSLPELVTSVIAALRGHSDVAFGNVIGSCIYNILGIGGTVAVIAPTEIPPEILRFDCLVMVGVSALILILGRTGNRISRAEGAALVAGYATYLYVVAPAV